MPGSIFVTLSLTGLGVAFFHAAIPTHWLPFVLAARVQNWSSPKTLAITCFAGTGHVAITAVIGLGLTIFGEAMNWTTAHWLPRVAAAVLIAFAVYYLVRQMVGRGHVHFGYPHEHFDHTQSAPAHAVSDRAAIVSLLMFLTLSPCEAFVPIYVSGIRYGWAGFATLTGILSIGTVAGMLVFTALSLAGLRRISLGRLERYESGIMAALLCIVGLLILVFEH